MKLRLEVITTSVEEINNELGLSDPEFVRRFNCNLLEEISNEISKRNPKLEDDIIL